jgi:hypothetical protein
MGAQARSQAGAPIQADPEAASRDDETSIPLATIERAITPVKFPDISGLTSLPLAYQNTSRFATAHQDDSISRLLGTSDPAAIGKFLTLNGMDGQDSTLFAGQSYAIPSESDDATPDEQAAGQQLLLADNARLARARAHGAAMQASESPTPTPPVGVATASTAPSGTIQYGALHADLPSDQELATLRRQQAAFSKTTRQVDIQNAGYALPVLAAPLLALGLGSAGAIADALAPEVEGAPLDFAESAPYLRVGDNWATRAGRRAHSWLEDTLDAKDGWDYEPDLERPGQRPLKPDAGTPRRNPLKPKKRYYLELKPNTPSGRAAAARAVKRYQGATDQKIRPIYYDPKDFM